MHSNKEIMSRLKFIGKIKENEKINVKNMFVQPVGIKTSISRTINRDNRAETLQFFQETIDRALELILLYSKSPSPSERKICSNMIKDLKQSKPGLLNSRTTYMYDIKYCCDIDTLIQEINAKLIEIEGGEIIVYEDINKIKEMKKD